MPGHEAKTVEPLKAALVCPECNLLLRDAVQTGDGIRLCETCFGQFQEYPNHTSPKSGVTIGKEYYPDKAVRREISQLTVLCLHIIYGCPWQGQLQHFEGHCRDCKYKPVRCPNPGCSALLPAEKLDSHVDGACPFRRLTCDHCREETAANQLEDHLNRCPKVPMECGRCPEWVARDLLKEHQLRDCPYVECPAPGCGEILQRKGTEKQLNTIASHLTDPVIQTEHLLALFNYCLNNFQRDQLQTQFGRLESTLHQHSEMLGQLTKRYTEMQHKITELSGYMSVLEKQNGTKTDKNWTTRLSSLEERQSKVEQTIRTLHSQHTSWNTSGMKFHEGSLSGTNYEIRVMDLEKRVEELYRQQAALKTHTSELEMQLQASLASTHNGSFLWRIPDVPRRKRDAIDERITSIYSPPFYTGRNGYKMCIRAYLNGDGSGHTTHLSLFFVLMKGEYDPLLKWPFDYKVSMILVDQNRRKHLVQTFKPTPESSSFQRPQTDMNVASGCPQFAKLSVLDDEDYVKENVMYIKCIVDTSRIFHP